MKKQIRAYINAKCLACGNVNEKMCRVGAFVMCQGCAALYFGKTYNPSSDIYKEYLEIYKNSG